MKAGDLFTYFQGTFGQKIGKDWAQASKYFAGRTLGTPVKWHPKRHQAFISFDNYLVAYNSFRVKPHFTSLLKNFEKRKNEFAMLLPFLYLNSKLLRLNKILR